MDISTNRVVSINPNDIFRQFGLESPEPVAIVNHRSATVAVERPIEDAEFEEVAPLSLTADTQEDSSSDLLEVDDPISIIAETTPEESPVSTNNIISINPRSFLVDESTSRFSGASWFSAIQNSTVILAGLGGIGSYVLFLLSRMKPKQVYIYDDDTVEIENLSGQLYSRSMLGERKVNAAGRLARDFSDYCGTMAIARKFTEESFAGDIMICGFDNMKARHLYFKKWREHVKTHLNPEKCLFIDGRLAAEEFQVFCMTGVDDYYMKLYADKYLFTDAQADVTQCSYKQTSYCANMIGSIMVNLFVNFMANTLKPIIRRDLPFKTYYDASLMYFKTEK